MGIPGLYIPDDRETLEGPEVDIPGDRETEDPEVDIPDDRETLEDPEVYRYPRRWRCVGRRPRSLLILQMIERCGKTENMVAIPDDRCGKTQKLI
jgi:hypothetical protein